MTNINRDFFINGLAYVIRPAIATDAKDLTGIRAKIDGETENLDREKGEAFINEENFLKLIQEDTEHDNRLFLVAEVNSRIVGFSRCEGNALKRFAHKAEFGVCILKDYWNHQIGHNLLKESICWADFNGIKKITLNVLQTNENAIRLYAKFGFEVEGVLKKDKLLSDGKYYDTIIMGRITL